MRRDLSNIIFSLDLTSPEDVELVVAKIQVFVKRQIPARFGVVPLASSTDSNAQLKVAHYLQETFGLSSLMTYWEEVRTLFQNSIVFAKRN